MHVLNVGFLKTGSDQFSGLVGKSMVLYASKTTALFLDFGSAKNKMALDPTVWGPSYWAMFHFVPYSYQDNPNRTVKEAMKNFLRTIPLLLPCHSCRDHALEYLTTADMDAAVTNRKTLARFFFDFHNSVNERLNKPQFDKKFDDGAAEPVFEGSWVETTTSWPMMVLASLTIAAVIAYSMFRFKTSPSVLLHK